MTAQKARWRTGVFLGLALATFCAAFPARADARAREAAKDLATRAAALVRQLGAKKACAHFRDHGSPWFPDAATYVSVVHRQGTLVCYPPCPVLTGQDSDLLRGPDRMPIYNAMVARAIASGQGWVSYRWYHPDTAEPARRASYVIRVGHHLVVEAGVIE